MSAALKAVSPQPGRHPKVAMILTGFSSRPSRRFLDKMRSVFPEYEFSCHVFTWNNWNIDQTRATFKGENIYEFDWYQHEKEIFPIVKNFQLSRTETNPINTISMFKLWKIAANKVENIDADFFIKLRVDNDIYFSREKSGLFDGFEGLSIPSGGDYRGGIGDHMAFGSRAEIKKYLDVFDSLAAIGGDGEILHPESLLRIYLINKMSLVVRRVPLIILCRGRIYNENFDISGMKIDRIPFEMDEDKYLDIASQMEAYDCGLAPIKIAKQLG